MANPTDFLGAIAKIDEVDRKVSRAVGVGAAAGSADFGFAATAQKVLAETRPAGAAHPDRPAAALFSGPVAKFNSPLSTSIIDSLRGPDLKTAFFAGGRPRAAAKVAHIGLAADIDAPSPTMGVLARSPEKLGGAGGATGFLGSFDPGCAKAAARIGGALAAAGLGETGRAEALGSKAAATGAPWAAAGVHSPDRASAYRPFESGLFAEGTGKALGALGLGAGPLSALKGLRAAGVLAGTAETGLDVGRVFGALGVAGELPRSLTDAHSPTLAFGVSPGAAGILGDLRGGGAVSDLLAGLGIGPTGSPRTAIAATELLAASFSFKGNAVAAAIGARPGPFPDRWSPPGGAFADAGRDALRSRSRRRGRRSPRGPDRGGRARRGVARRAGRRALRRVRTLVRRSLAGDAGGDRLRLGRSGLRDAARGRGGAARPPAAPGRLERRPADAHPRRRSRPQGRLSPTGAGRGRCDEGAAGLEVAFFERSRPKTRGPAAGPAKGSASAAGPSPMSSGGSSAARSSS